MLQIRRVACPSKRSTLPKPNVRLLTEHVIRRSMWLQTPNLRRWYAACRPCWLGLSKPELVPYLPTNFEFTKPEYTLDWDNFTGGGPSAPYQIGVTVWATDPKLMSKVVQILGADSPYYWTGTSFTYMLIDASGNY